MATLLLLLLIMDFARFGVVFFLWLLLVLLLDSSSTHWWCSNSSGFAFSGMAVLVLLLLLVAIMDLDRLGVVFFRLLFGWLSGSSSTHCCWCSDSSEFVVVVAGAVVFTSQTVFLLGIASTVLVAVVSELEFVEVTLERLENGLILRIEAEAALLTKELARLGVVFVEDASALVVLTVELDRLGVVVVEEAALVVPTVDLDRLGVVFVAVVVALLASVRTDTSDWHRLGAVFLLDAVVVLISLVLVDDPAVVLTEVASVALARGLVLDFFGVGRSKSSNLEAFAVLTRVVDFCACCCCCFCRIS